MKKDKKKELDKKHSSQSNHKKTSFLKVGTKRSDKNIGVIENVFGDNQNLKIKITGSKEDLEMLYSLFYFHNQIFNDIFAESFIDRIPKLFKQRGYINIPPGKVLLNSQHDRKSHVLRNIKIMSAVLYKYFSYCFRNYKKALPSYIQNITKEAEDAYEDLKNIKIQPDPLRYTMYCLQTVYGDDLLKEYKLNPYSDTDNFKITYIQEGKEIIKKDYDWAVVVWFNVFSNPEKKDATNFLRNMSRAFTTMSGNIQKLSEDSLSIRNMLNEIFPWFKEEIDDILIRSFHGFNSKKELQLFMQKNNLKSYDDLAQYWVDYNKRLEKQILDGKASVTIY